MFDRFHNLGEILQDQSTRETRPLASKVKQVMAEAAAYIDHQNIMFSDLNTVNELPLYRIKTRICPARTALSIHTHMVIKPLGSDRFPLYMLEEAQRRAIAHVERRIHGVGRIAVRGLLEERGEGEDALGEARCPVISEPIKRERT